LFHAFRYHFLVQECGFLNLVRFMPGSGELELQAMFLSAGHPFWWGCRFGGSSWSTWLLRIRTKA
jgi:hypothetical protein